MKTNISKGQSKTDRITYFTSKISATAIRLSNGEIQIKTELKNNEFEKKFSTFAITLLESAIILAILYCPHFLKSMLIMPNINNSTPIAYLYLIPALIYLTLTIILIKRCIDDKALRKNHGAEHMVLNAYIKLKRIPTTSEVKKFSRLAFECSSNLFPALFFAQLIGFFIYQCTGYIIPEILLFIVPHLFSGLFPLGYLAQLLTTKKPDDASIELALAALEAAEEFHMKTTDSI